MKLILNLGSKKIFIYIFVLVFGVLLGIGITRLYNPLAVDNVDELRLGGYQYINPLYECSTNEFVGSKDFANLKSKLEDQINIAIEKPSTAHVSIYFRDLNKGSWFGINEKENFSPASLLKLPIMITYYKEAEQNPLLLQKEVEFNVPVNQGAVPVIKPTDQALIGNKYTIETLIEKMIIYSDNNSLGILSKNIPREKIDDISLDLHIPKADTLNDFMNVKEYSTLFRVLFNASYLNKYYSEKALKLLAKSNFNDGIKKPIPQNIPIAHKFGERSINGSSLFQLHDCGIIYYPDHPYLICVMTRGNDFEQLKKEIQNISKLVYEDIKDRYK